MLDERLRIRSNSASSSGSVLFISSNAGPDGGTCSVHVDRAFLCASALAVVGLGCFSISHPIVPMFLFGFQIGRMYGWRETETRSFDV
jgi:hypothetical protein